MFNNPMNRFGMQNAPGAGAPRGLQGLFQQMMQRSAQPSAATPRPGPIGQSAPPAGSNFPGSNMQGFPQQPQDPMQRLRTLDMQRISQASQNPMQHLETLMKGAPTMGNPGYPGFTQNDSYAVLRSPGNPGFPAFDPNKPQVQPPPGGFFGVPPGYPGNPGFPANSGYPTMQGYPGVPFSGTSGTPGTFASEPMQGYPGMGPMGGQDIRSIAGVAPPNPNGPPMSTEQLKLLASNLGYQTAQGSPGMFGGGPMGMGPMLGGVPSQIGGQDIRNLIGGQPQQPQLSPQDAVKLFTGRPVNQPQPPAGLPAALPQMNTAMTSLFGRGMFKSGGAVQGKAKKKGA